MKKAVTTALLAALLASTAAETFAQDAPRGRAGERRERPEGSPERSSDPAPAAERRAPPPERRPEPNRAGRAGIIDRNAPRPPPQAAPPPQAPQAPQARPAPRPPGADGRYGGGPDRNDRDRNDRDRGDRDWGDRDRGGDDRRWDDGRRGGDPRWNDGRRPNDHDRPRYDRRHYPPVYRIPHRYHVPPYRRPPGWYSFSWGFGDVLPNGWYGSNYRILDWWSYGLPMPPLGYDWIRVGDDALLVDNFSGRVVQVVYDLFW